MAIEIIPLERLKANKKFARGLSLVAGIKSDYQTAKHISFTVESENGIHNVMYFDEKSGDLKWQCDCKWYTLQNKVCSHIIAVNLMLIKRLRTSTHA